MVVDDEPLIRRTVARFLSSAGCAVSTAGSAKECLSVFEPGKFDVLVSDVDLKDTMDGIALVERLRSDDVGLRAVLVTGLPTHEPRARSIGVRMLFKPFALADLLDSVLSA